MVMGTSAISSNVLPGLHPITIACPENRAENVSSARTVSVVSPERVALTRKGLPSPGSVAWGKSMTSEEGATATSIPSFSLQSVAVASPRK